MSGLTATFADILVGLSQSFRLSAFFPAAMFVMVSLTMAGQYIGESELYKALVGSSFGELIFVTSVSLAVSYALSILNVSLTQLYEGYLFRHTIPGRWLTLLQIQRFEWMDEKSEKLAQLITNQEKALKKHAAKKFPLQWRDLIYWNTYQKLVGMQTEKAMLDAEKHNVFPSDKRQIMPTRLGNVFAAFEEYPRLRYGIDAVALWPRMVPTLIKSGYGEVIERQKMGFDFFLNLSFLTGMLSIEYAAMSLYFAAELNIIVVTLCALLTWVFYRFAILAAAGYGATVKVSFDLHRAETRKSLNLVEPQQFDQEVKQWRAYAFFTEQYDVSSSAISPIKPDDMFQHDNSSTGPKV